MGAAEVLSKSETRNSELREIVSTPIQSITRLIHKELPWLSPTHLNILGAAEVALGSIIAAKGKKGIAAALIISGSCMDAFDGPLARLMASEDPQSVNFKRGALYDVLSDRVQELALAISRAWSAKKRGGALGKISELATFAAVITSPLPSVSRAFSESRGKAVPESGKGIFGLIGTRPGRATSGGLATLYPEPKGIPFQLVADIATTTSNAITTADRLKTAFSKKEANLSKEVRKEAKTRLAVLGIFTAIALASSLFTYYRLHRKQVRPLERESFKDNDFVRVVTAIERYCQEQGLDHRFVGGTVTDLIGPQTKFAIDVAKRTVTLRYPNRPTLRRSDGTIKDIDLVIFTPSRDKFDAAREYFNKWETEIIGFPQVSIEAAFYPDWPPRKKWKQFVTAFEVDQQGILNLVFGKIKQEIKPASIEPWTLSLGDGIQFNVFNPVAHALCYELRVPSGIKKKDKEIIGKFADGSGFSKMTLIGRLADQERRAGYLRGINYRDLYTEWRNYIWMVHHQPDLLTKAKAATTNLYWNTVGTYVSHRVRGNRFTG